MAFTDMQGRLLGKRLHRDFFFEQVEHGHGTEGCNYLLALDMEMDPVPGYEIASWERGYGDFELTPDLVDAAAHPVARGDGARALRRRAGRTARRSGRRRARCCARSSSGRRSLGFEVMVGSELEFYLLKETYEEAHAKHYRDLTPSVPYILDYHILATTYDEPLLRQIRNGMLGAGIRVETSKGEAWPGQHEINFRYADALRMADNHASTRTARRRSRILNGCSITFMAKPDHDVDRIVVPHPLVALARRRERVRGRDGGLQPVPRRPDRVRARARALLRAERQLVQAVRGRLVGADDARVGSRQPDVRRSASSGTGRVAR